MDTTVALSIGSFVLVLAVLVLLRAMNSRCEVKPADIVVAVLPVVVFLLVTGRLQKFELGESGVKIETAFVNASASAIVSQVTQITATGRADTSRPETGRRGDSSAHCT